MTATESPETTTAARAGRREWIALFVLAVPTLLLSIDMSVLYLALPELSEQLHASSTEQLWVLDVYGFMVAGFLVTMGNLGDRWGRRRLLLAGAAGFTAASTLAAFSTNPEMLIAARALMGITGATLMPSTLALISSLFADATQRGTAIAVWMSCFMGGMVVGPLVGGVMLAHFWWGSVFLLAIPVLALLFAARGLLPEHRNPVSGRLDLTSVGLSLLAILPLIFALKEVTRHGVHTTPVVAAAVAVVGGWLFVRRQRTLADPLLDLALFARPAFRTAIAVNIGAGITMAGTFLLVSQYLQLVLGRDPLQAGMWLVPGQLVMIVASLATPKVAARFGRQNVIVGGLLLAVVGFVLLTQLDAPAEGGPTTPLPLMLVFALCAVGIAAPMALVIDLVVGSVPPARAGAASAVSETGAEFGISFGIAAFGSIGASVYRSGLDLPASVPSGAAASIRESLAGATSVAGTLPDGASILAGAQTAFTHGLGVVAIIGAVLFAAMAVLARRGFRGIDAEFTAVDAEPTVVEDARVPVAV